MQRCPNKGISSTGVITGPFFDLLLVQKLLLCAFDFATYNELTWEACLTSEAPTIPANFLAAAWLSWQPCCFESFSSVLLNSFHLPLPGVWHWHWF